MSANKHIFTAGFAMFSMFFGSGNLVFPLLIGYASQDHYFYGILGLFITAVCVPFLGLLGIILYEGKHQNYFSCLGNVPSFLLIALMVALMGLGVVPRCIMVAFGGVSLVFPELPFTFFSLIFCCAITLLIWQKNRVISLIGIVLTPFKLGGILLIITAGLLFGKPAPQGNMSALDVFQMGLFQGYQTLDLVAALFFACSIYAFLKNSMPSQTSLKDLLSMAIKSSLIGSLLLSLIYVGFVMLGAKYAPYLTHTPPETMLAEIARLTLGNYALPIISFTLAISCLATATILSTIFVDFIKEDVARHKISRFVAILIAMGSAFLLSLLGFKAICALLGTLLTWIYPFLLMFAIYRIIARLKATEVRCA